jgi:hypothetical protein
LIEKEMKMSKVVCSVAINLTRIDMGTVAQIVLDRIEDDFGPDAMLVAGLYEQELFDALINSKKFQSIVGKKVAEDGRIVCEDPYGYFDAFDFIEYIDELQAIYDRVDEAADILTEAEKSDDVTCIPVPAGYKLVKI